MIYIYDILSKKTTFIMHSNIPYKNAYIYIKILGNDY